MNKYKPGNIIIVNNTDLLILDETKDAVFVLAYNLNIKTKFGERNNEYKDSRLQKEIDNWLAATNFHPISRRLELNTTDDAAIYDILIVRAAPLTFDEYRRYSPIIKPYIKTWFWLANKWSNNSSSRVCLVDSIGTAISNHYGINNGALVPAFILPKDDFKNPLSNFSTKELLDEISRRNSQ